VKYYVATALTIKNLSIIKVDAVGFGAGSPDQAKSSLVKAAILAGVKLGRSCQLVQILLGTSSSSFGYNSLIYQRCHQI